MSSLIAKKTYRVNDWISYVSITSLDFLSSAVVAIIVLGLHLAENDFVALPLLQSEA